MQFFGHRQDAVMAGPAVIHDHADEAQLKTAYEQGRRDGRRSRRRSPLLVVTVGCAALVGAAVLALAAGQGSFTAGGQVVDRNLSVAADQAKVTSRDAAAATGEAVRDAGANLRDRATGREG